MNSCDYCQTDNIEDLDKHLETCLAFQFYCIDCRERFSGEDYLDEDEYSLEDEMQDYPERFYVDEETGEWERF